MASIRRTLSPMARSGTTVNGEACSTASPLSKTYSCNSNHQNSRNLLSSCFSSLNYVFYRAQTCLFTIFSLRSSRPMEKSKSIRKSWRRSLVHFFVCFFLGAFTGLISIVSSNSSLTLFSQHQTFSFEILKSVDKSEKSVTKSVASGIPYSSFSNILIDHDRNVSNPKFLIVVTPTYDRPLQVYYLNRLARTLKLVPSPLLWIVVEISSQSIETAELLRNSGVMYRHLVCSENLTDSKNKGVHLLNVALKHIEIHHLDGITYFADDDNIYAIEVFDQMRQIRRFGTWIIGKFIEPKSEIILDGPICNGSQVLGWHKNKVNEKLCRFHVEMGGFAFNSTILWDPKRWHRPTLESVRVLDTESVRVLDTVKDDDDYISSLIEQIVEDESQMEGFPSNCSRVMVWQHNFVQFEVHHLNSTQNVSLPNRLVT